MAEKRIRKTTTGKGRNYRKASEGAGMTKAGVAAYNHLKNDFEIYLRKLKGLEYDIEDLSQRLEDEYQLWHCTRNNNSESSNMDRIKETADFAWSKLFNSARNSKINDLAVNTNAIKDFGQAVHAFQDMYVHRGAIYDGSLFDDHSDTLDIFPGEKIRSKMERMTRNVLRVFTLLTEENLDDLINKQINLWGIESNLFDELNEKVVLKKHVKNDNVYSIVGI